MSNLGTVIGSRAFPSHAGDRTVLRAIADLSEKQQLEAKLTQQAVRLSRQAGHKVNSAVFKGRTVNQLRQTIDELEHWLNNQGAQTLLQPVRKRNGRTKRLSVQGGRADA